MISYTVEQANAFEDAYAHLKKAKTDEAFLKRHRQQILSAADDGVSDSDLIQALKGAYPNIKVTRQTIRKLRALWVSDPALPVVDSSGI